jgi:O-antigen/teichoic acid export membrane protein
MGNIRKQTIVSSLLVYVGVLIGAFNQLFFTRNGSFTADEYGLTRVFLDFGATVSVFAGLGVVPIIYKFYPYYKDHLEERKIDLISWAFVVALIGFTVVVITGYYLEPLIIRKYSATSKLLTDYYYWMFPVAFGMLLFSVLEGLCIAIHKTVLSNFLKETAIRFITAAIVLLYYFKKINFTTFVYLFSFIYLLVVVILLVYLIRIGKFRLTFTQSRVTRRFRKKMFAMQAYILGGTLIQSLASTIDSFLIAGLKGLSYVGIFGLAQYAASIVQVPQRSIQSVTTGVLSKAWKDKNMAEIQRIYERSSINLLLMALFIYGLISLNAIQGMDVLGIQQQFKQGIGVIFILGLARLIDAGTGVNGVIIGTSTRWKFDFWSGVVLLIFRIPLTWFLIVQFGIIGSAIAEVFSYFVYNGLRFQFLRRQYNMQPFSSKTVYALISGMVAFGAAYLLYNMQGWAGIVLRTAIFSGIMIASVFAFKLTPDAMQLWYKWTRRT